jgi:hypothetical protein
MNKYILLFLLILVRLTAATYYVTQAGAGSADGSSLGNAASIATLASHTAAAGDTISLNGTITSQIVVHNGGSSGSPVTYLFASGAKMSKGTWGGAAALDIGGNSYVTVDGGATGTIGGYNGNPALANGIIESTTNGTGLTTQNNDGGITSHDCHNVIVKGLVIRNMYVRTTGGTDTNQYGIGFYDFWNGGTAPSNVTCTNCIFHDESTGCGFDYGPSASTLEMSFCTSYNCNWGGNAGDHGASSTLTGLLVHDNYFYNWQTWTSSNAGVQAALHHNGFYGWAESGGSLRTVSAYNNFCGPGYDSTQSSAGLFFSGDIGSITIYNNILYADSGGSSSDGLIMVWKYKGANDTNLFVYNNTIVSTGSAGVGIEVFSGGGSGTVTATYTVKNNVISTTATAIADYYNTLNTLVADYNIGYNLNSSESYNSSSTGSAGFMNFASWQGLGYDTHGSSSNPNLNGSYVPQPTSSAISAGVNLSSVFTLDFAGLTRPASAAWDIGALQNSGGGPVSVSITNPFKLGSTTCIGN